VDLMEEIRKIAAGIPAELKEDKKGFILEWVVAERKSFLAKKKLVYQAKIRLDQEGKKLRFSERLKESGFGLSAGGEGGDDPNPGFGFKKETYRTGWGPREGTLEEQSNLFGRKYQYRFDFGLIRRSIEAKCVEAGYRFESSVF
jgi:hypothetical protein